MQGVAGQPLDTGALIAEAFDAPAQVVILSAFVVFCRIGGCLLLIPGFSSARVPVRARLFVAIAVALALTPLLLPAVRPNIETAAPVRLLGLIAAESAKGALIGLLGRLFFVALETATMAVSLAIGLSSTLNEAMESDEAMPPIAALVSVAAVLLIFVTDLHWEVFRGLAQSYRVLPVDAGFDPRTSLVQLTDGATRTFLFTLRIAAPFLAFSVIGNFAVGLINKLVPVIPVSFIATPFLIAGGLVILYFTIHPALDLFTAAFGGFLRNG